MLFVIGSKGAPVGCGTGPRPHRCHAGPAPRAARTIQQHGRDRQAPHQHLSGRPSGLPHTPYTPHACQMLPRVPQYARRSLIRPAICPTHISICLEHSIFDADIVAIGAQGAEDCFACAGRGGVFPFVCICGRSVCALAILGRSGCTEVEEARVQGTPLLCGG